jgi:hypothetical protein
VPLGFLWSSHGKIYPKKKIPLISWVISPTWVDHSCRVIDHAVGACILTWKFFTGRMINNTTPLLHPKSNNKCGGRFLIFVVSTDCIWKNKSESKNRELQVFEKFQNQRTTCSGSNAIVAVPTGDRAQQTYLVTIKQIRDSAYFSSPSGWLQELGHQSEKPTPNQWHNAGRMACGYETRFHCITLWYNNHSTLGGSTAKLVPNN